MVYGNWYASYSISSRIFGLVTRKLYKPLEVQTKILHVLVNIKQHLLELLI